MVFFEDSIVSPHIHSLVQQHLATHPHLHVTIQWIPGHQGMGGNEKAHALSRAEGNPGPPTLWPESYDPHEHRKQLHKERTVILKELRMNALTLPPPPPHFTREEGSILRRAQTHTLMTSQYTHYIQGLLPPLRGLPLQHTNDVGMFPRKITRIYHVTPTPPRPAPYLLGESWVAPPEEHRQHLLPLLIWHVHTVLGEDW